MSIAAENIAFRGTYADWKLVKTRGVIQVVIEIPLAEADAAYDVLGGMPNPANERWFAIAALNSRQESKPVSERPQPGPDKPRAGGKRDWRDLPPAQQAGIRCNEPVFASFLMEERKSEWRECCVEAASDEANAAECVRLICGVKLSRSELNTNQKARVIWHQLNDEYEAWMRVGA